MDSELTTKREETQAIAPALDIQALAEQALARGGEDGVKNLAAIIALGERMEDRAKDAERKAAIAAAKTEFTPVKRTHATNNTKLRNDGTITSGGYAKIEDIQAMVDPVFSGHGLDYRWGYTVEDGKSWLVFYVTHANGTEEERSRTEYMPDNSGSKSPSQARGSGESYAMRYTMRMGLSVRFADDCSEDDDGAAGGDPLTEDQALTIESKLAESGADVAAFCRAYGIGSGDPADLSADSFDAAVRQLNTKIRRASQKGGE